jgi:hypothetical protein
MMAMSRASGFEMAQYLVCHGRMADTGHDRARQIYIAVCSSKFNCACFLHVKVIAKGICFFLKYLDRKLDPMWSN